MLISNEECYLIESVAMGNNNKIMIELDVELHLLYHQTHLFIISTNTEGSR